jgi:hypothetical protein
MGNSPDQVSEPYPLHIYGFPTTGKTSFFNMMRLLHPRVMAVDTDVVTDIIAPDYFKKKLWQLNDPEVESRVKRSLLAVISGLNENNIPYVLLSNRPTLVPYHIAFFREDADDVLKLSDVRGPDPTFEDKVEQWLEEIQQPKNRPHAQHDVTLDDDQFISNFIELHPTGWTFKEDGDATHLPAHAQES